LTKVQRSSVSTERPSKADSPEISARSCVSSETSRVVLAHASTSWNWASLPGCAVSARALSDELSRADV
jgi:hypothetical protein